MSGALMILVGYISKGAALGLSAAASPGPFQAYLINQSVRLGWRKVLPASLAPLISDGPIIFLVTFALTFLNAAFLRWLQIAGSLFVIYLGWRAYRSFREFQRSVEQSPSDGGHSLPQAVLMNFLNPNPWIFWSVFAGPVLLTGWHEHPSNGIGFLVGFYAAMISVLVLLIILSGSSDRLGPRFQRAVLGISAVVLVILGLYQLWQGIMRDATLM